VCLFVFTTGTDDALVMDYSDMRDVDDDDAAHVDSAFMILVTMVLGGHENENAIKWRKILKKMKVLVTASHVIPMENPVFFGTEIVRMFHCFKYSIINFTFSNIDCLGIFHCHRDIDSKFAVFIVTQGINTYLFCYLVLSLT
jgi:hypothetical protein